MFNMMANTQTAAAKNVEMDAKLAKAMREDSVDQSAVLEELRATKDDSLNHSNHNFRARLERFLESTPLEVFLVVLVIIDVIILLAMLLMDLNILHMLLEDNVKASGEIVHLLSENCLGNEDLSHYNGTNLVTLARYLDHDGCVWDPHSGVNGTKDDFSAVGDHHRRRRSAGPAKEGANPTAVMLGEIVHALHISSICILAIMVFEVLLKIFALGARYFKGKLEVADGVVIIISFTLDLYFIDGVSGGDGVNNGATVLVILLLWRILRVFNALLVTAKKRLQFRIRVQKRMRKALEDKVQSLNADIHTHEIHIGNLTKLAERNDADEYEIKACKPIVKQSKKVNTQAGLASMMQMSMGLLQGMNNMKVKESNGTQSNGNGTQSNGIANNVKEECLDNGKGEESVSGVMESAIDSSDVRPDKLVPVDFMSAMATGPPQSNGESFDRSVSRRSGGKSIPGVEFAAAVALNNKHGETNGHATKPRERTLSNGSISFEVKPSETSTSSPTPLIS